MKASDLIYELQRLIDKYESKDADLIPVLVTDEFGISLFAEITKIYCSPTVVGSKEHDSITMEIELSKKWEYQTNNDRVKIEIKL